jgi:copper chaperone
MQTVTLKAPDISCGHCVQAISQAVESLDGARMLAGDPATKQVTIEYDPSKVSLSAIEAAMEEEGYPVMRNA